MLTASTFTHSGAIALTSAYYGAGSGPIYLDNVGCFGSEGSLLACVSLPVGSHNCVHGEDASVQCVGKGKAFLKIIMYMFNCHL